MYTDIGGLVCILIVECDRYFGGGSKLWWVHVHTKYRYIEESVMELCIAQE